VIVWRSEGVLGDRPTRRENDKVTHSNARPHRLTCQHGEYWRILETVKQSTLEGAHRAT